MGLLGTRKLFPRKPKPDIHPKYCTMHTAQCLPLRQGDIYLMSHSAKMQCTFTSGAETRAAVEETVVDVSLDSLLFCVLDNVTTA